MGLALFTKASGALSMGWRRRAPSPDGLRSPGRKVNSESLCAPGDQPEKEREGERERKTQGPELWWSKGVLINMVWAYIPSYKVVIFSKDKEENSRLIKHRQSILKREIYKQSLLLYGSQEGRGYLSPYRNTNEGNAWIPQPLGEACLSS